MCKIKIGLLIDEFFGGAGTAFGGYGFLARKYIAKYIPDKDIEMDILLEMKEDLKEIQTEKVDNILVYKFPKNEKKVKQWLKQQNYDLFLSIEMTYPSYEILKLIDDKKLVLWIQDPRPPKLWDEKRNSMTTIQDPCVCNPLVSDLVNKMFYKGRIKFISQGNSLNERAFELYNLPKDLSVQYLPNPIEIDFEYKFDINKKKKQVVFLGRLEAQKRAWLFCEVAKCMPEYEFYVLGKFFRHEKENNKMLEQYMNENIPNLHFMGHLEGEKKEKLLKESRILLNTSIWEGIPISWLECLQYGTLPVSCLDNESLSSRFGAFVGEILGDGSEDVEKFIPSIKVLMENDSLYIKNANAAIKYIRKTHNIKTFQKNLKSVLLKLAGLPITPFNGNIPKPIANYIDVKITYACNYKCEYCYQADENGIRESEFLSKENAQNLLKFLKRLKEKYQITLAGGEPFVYPHLNFLSKNLAKMGHKINIITNFSSPIETLEKFLKMAGRSINAFSISIHISQIPNFDEFYNKLQRLIDIQKENNYPFKILLTCVLTEDNFEKLKEVDKVITERFGLPLEIQRKHHITQYDTYPDEIENFMQARGLDVPIELANNINFYGRKCWCGSKFFYIESTGEVRKCYTAQENEAVWILGNLSEPDKIRINKDPAACISRDNGNCVCYKHFVRQGFLTPYYADNSEIEKLKRFKNVSLKNQAKYQFYRFISNVTFGKIRETMIDKKQKWKDMKV